MDISAIQDAYGAILHYKSIKHLCPTMQGIFFFCPSLLKILLKREKKYKLWLKIVFFLDFCIFTTICKKINQR